MRKRTHRRGKRLRIEQLEARQLLAADTFLVNFQFDEASIPTRYLRDTGDVFGDRGNGLNYGWSADHTDQSRERSADPDQRLDTLVHFELGEFWEFELDNGLYEVTVAVGDPSNNDGVHTINVNGANFFDAVPDGNGAMVQTQQVSVSDGRLTVDQGAAANKATRINYIHIVGLSDGANASPLAPTVTEPTFDGQEVNPADVHMEAVGFSDSDGDGHRSTDWQIWTVGDGAELVWETLGIEGVERLHTHLGDGFFQNALAGEIALDANTDYELRVRYRDTAGSVSDYSTRLFTTGDASTVFALEIQDIVTTPAPTWVNVGGGDVELPSGEGILAPGDPIIAFDFDSDGGTASDSPGDEQAPNAIDNDPGTKYLNFGEINTGFIVTPSASSVVRSFTITTANDAPERDPTSYVLQGTTDPITSAAHSNGRNETWTTISSGTIDPSTVRFTTTDPISFVNNTSYTSYRLYFPTVRDQGAANSMQISEVDFYTGTAATGSSILADGNFVIPIQEVEGDPMSQSASPGGEGPANAIDGISATKYLNFGKENSGFIVTPAVGATTVTSFQITTADDAEERDPTDWQLYGTNDSIVSQNNGFGDDENWILIDTGTVSLPATREAAGPVVDVDNNTAYSSYRMVFTAVKDTGAADSVQIGDIQFFGDGTGGATAPMLTVQAGDTGDPLLQIVGSDAPGNVVTDFPELAEHTPIRVIVEAGSQSLSLPQTDLAITDETSRSITIFLPAINLVAGGRIDLWVSSAGATYFGTQQQNAPDFSTLARAAELDVPFVVTQAGFVIEEVGSDYRLPVNIAFVPDPGPNPDDPLYYVTELYGSIQVVTRDGTRHEFATGLLDYNPQGPISGSGEQGLTGITVQRDEVDPDVYHLYVGMLWDNGDPPGGPVHFPKVERITSASGGLSMDSRTVLLNMQPETQGQSHQISNVSIGPDGLLYVHVGDGFNSGTALDLDQFRGSVLRMNLDGTAPSDNPFYDDSDGINSRDYIYAYGLRNPFGGSWRASDESLYYVGNGPSVDRLARIDEGESYGWDGSNASMFVNALYNWDPAHAPVNISFIQRETFAGSQFPASFMDTAFVSESGPTYASGPQSRGKQITQFVLNAAGDNVISGPTPLVQYVGEGHASVVGLAAGPDGLYFTTLYEDSGSNGPTASGARIYRVRYVNTLAGDYDIDGDVDRDDYDVWRSSFGSNLLLAADGNRDGRVDIADYTVWRDAYQSAQAAASLAVANEGARSSGVDVGGDQVSPSATDDAFGEGFWQSPSRGGGSTSVASGAAAGRGLGNAPGESPSDNDLWYFADTSDRSRDDDDSLRDHDGKEDTEASVSIFDDVDSVLAGWRRFN